MIPRPKLSPSEELAIITKLPLPQSPKNGSFPNYISEFKIREFIEKEYERLVEKQKGYPPGTFKEWEEDRILIFTNLFLIKEELKKFPVDYFLRSIGIRNRRREIESRLDEIDYAIRLFQIPDVFLKFYNLNYLTFYNILFIRLYIKYNIIQNSKNILTFYNMDGRFGLIPNPQ